MLSLIQDVYHDGYTLVRKGDAIFTMKYCY
jgi:hypothetical protein